MSEEVHHVTVQQLDEMLEAGVKIAEKQAEDYVVRGQAGMATYVLKQAIERRNSERARLIAASQQRQAQPAPGPAPIQQAVPQSPTPGGGQPAAAAPGTQAPTASDLTPEQRVSEVMERQLAHIPMHLRPMIPGETRARMYLRAREAAGIDGRTDPSMPFGLSAPRKL